jgi:hypothetical protein
MKKTGRLLTGVSLLTVAAVVSLGGNASASTARAATYLPPHGDLSPKTKSGIWKDVNGPIPATNPDALLLLTDGRVMVHSACTPNWYFLTPDKKGRYETGAWSTDAASMPSGYAPYLFASQILPDGRLMVNGGEYNKNCSTKAWTTLGALYDPAADSWTSVSPPSGWGFIGNAQSTILPNGTYMLADCCDNPGNAALASISGTRVTWTKQATVSCGGGLPCNDNEGWTPLPDGDLLTVDVWNTGANYNSVEVYDTSKGTWSSAAHTAELLSDSTFEIGPAVLRPDGTVIQFGANAGGHNDLYTVSSGAWKTGPSFPVVGSVRPTCYHAPAALLPDGNVLVQASPMFAAPSHFFEFSVSAKGQMALTQVNEPAQAPNTASRYGSFLELPTGQVLWVNDATLGSAEVATYTPKGTARTSWLPVVASVASTLKIGSTGNAISGTNFNGFSQGASYGSDRQMSTNYPLVRITNNKSGDVCFGRSYNFSTMGVWTSGTTNATFDIPKSCKAGAGALQVIVNGLASAGVSVKLGK